ncbi:MAG: hypothetical protein E4H14_11715 [Candidatus Thorarchaeota archaeon]|nr:MAG: hypothetical protein E4H14_11715 [Candidatus Thorarchaeota archaeon]
MTEASLKEIFDRISKIKSAGVIERYGFTEFLAFAKEVRNSVSDEIWLEVGWDILEGMGLEELYGCDYDILTDLENIPEESDLVDIQSFLRHTLVETLLEQFDSGGTTVLLDIGKMLETPASVLIPRIVELRKIEIENLVVPIIGKKLAVFDVYMNEVGITTDPKDAVHLDDLWKTAYGFQILRSLDFGLRTDLDGLRKIEIVMDRIGLTLRTKFVTEPIVNPKSKMTDAMNSILTMRSLGIPKKSRKKKFS